MKSQFKKGVLELIVMMSVAKQDLYGYELVKKVCATIEVNEGTIYPLLKRMTNEAIFETYLQESSEGPPRKYYRMTTHGLGVMEKLKEEWSEFSKRVNQFIDESEEK